MLLSQPNRHIITEGIHGRFRRQSNSGHGAAATVSDASVRSSRRRMGPKSWSMIWAAACRMPAPKPEMRGRPAKVAEEIRAAGGEATFNTESVTDMRAVEGMVEQAMDTFGGLHGVINPAGILRDGMFHKMSEADWKAVIDVHLHGSFNVARATIEHFREQEDGALVLFTSTSGLIGNIGQANYAAAKMGIAGLSRIVAMEGARKNVRSNIIGPLCLDPDDRIDPGEGRSWTRAGRADAHGHARRPGRPARRHPVRRWGAGCERADLLRARQ